VASCFISDKAQLLLARVLNTTKHTAISIKEKIHEQSGKVEYERERLLGIANKLINELSKRFPAAFRARIRLFRFARGQP
jgi:hypothetical protein